MRASRFPNTDEKSRVNTMPMAARPTRRRGASLGLAAVGGVVEIWDGRGRSEPSELGRASTEDEDDYLPRFFCSPVWGRIICRDFGGVCYVW